MTTLKMVAFGLAVVVLTTCSAQQGLCDVIGSTYSFDGTIFAENADGSLAAGAFAQDGSGVETFDGTTKTLGNLNFGNAGDVMVVQETQTLAADGITYTVTVLMVAEDAAGNLTTWTAVGQTVDHDGDVNTPEIPRSVSFMDLAEFNGGTDALDVIVPAGSIYNFVDSNSLVVTTAGDVLGFADTADPTGGIATGEFTGAIGFGSDGDLALPVAALGNVAIAGYGFTWTYTVAIPEPNTALGLLFGLGALVSNRRRRA